MRSIVFLTALLMIVPLAAAQGPGSGGSGGPPGGAGGPPDTDGDGLPDQWERKYFGNLSYDGSDDPDGDGRNNTVEYQEGTDPTVPDRSPEDGDEQQPGGPRSACRGAEDRQECLRQQCEGEERHASCRGVERAQQMEADARHVRFDIDATGSALYNYSVGGVVLLERISYGDANQTFDVEQHDRRIRLVSGDARLEIQDNPTGQFWFRSSNGSILLEFPPEAEVNSTAHGFTIDYPDRSARVVGDDVALTPDGIVAQGHLSFYSPVGPGSVPGAEVRQAVEEAKERRQIGAEVRIAAQSGGPPGHERVQVSTFDEVDVNVSLPERIQGRDAMRVVVDANLDSGRTIVLDVDRATLAGDKLIVQYFDVENGTETEVAIHRASSLEDVLDANDDDGRPEYWIVESEDGIQLFVSVPNWSVHVIQLSALLQPSVLIGVFAGVAGAAVATVAMFRPRRREAW